MPLILPIAPWFSKLLVASLLLLVTVLPSHAQYSGGQSIDKIIAQVDNYIVLKSDLETAYQESQRPGNPAGELTRCQVLQQLVVEKLMLAKAEIDSVVVEEDRVTSELDRRLQYFVDNYGEENIEQQFGKTIDEFREELRDDIRNQLVVQQMQQTITQDIEVSPAEVKKFFNAIPQDSLPFYSSEVAVGQIVKRPIVNKDQKSIARTKLEEIRARIINGEDFGTLAKEYSQDPGSGAQGGELGFVTRGQFVPEFEAVALKMQPGDLSEPVESDFGFHLIQLIERRGNRYNSRHILIKPAASSLDIKAAEDFLDSLRTQILADSLPFAKAAKDNSDDRQTAGSGGFFTTPDGSNRVSTENLDPVVFFTIDTMQVGDITRPLVYRTPDGEPAARILYVKSKSKPHQANLRNDYQKIYNAALQEKRTRILNQWFDDAHKQVYVNIDPEYSHCDVSASI